MPSSHRPRWLSLQQVVRSQLRVGFGPADHGVGVVGRQLERVVECCARFGVVLHHRAGLPQQHPSGQVVRLLLEVRAQFIERLRDVSRLGCGRLRAVQRRRRTDQEVHAGGGQRQRQRDAQRHRQRAAWSAAAPAFAQQRPQQHGQRHGDHRRGGNVKRNDHQSSPLSVGVSMGVPSRRRLRTATSTTSPPATRISAGPNHSNTVPGCSGGLYSTKLE